MSRFEDHCNRMELLKDDRLGHYSGCDPSYFRLHGFRCQDRRCSNTLYPGERILTVALY